ncbi:MAG: hypothetical protein ACE5J9_08365 [Methanosarcinales archaeon]
MAKKVFLKKDIAKSMAEIGAEKKDMQLINQALETAKVIESESRKSL